MAKKKALEVVKFVKKCLIDDGLDISKIILFGSNAKGKASPDSDIDIIVISESFRNKGIFKRVELIKRAEISAIKKFMIPLDILVMTNEEFESENSLISDYAQESIVI